MKKILMLLSILLFVPSLFAAVPSTEIEVLDCGVLTDANGGRSRSAPNLMLVTIDSKYQIKSSSIHGTAYESLTVVSATYLAQVMESQSYKLEVTLNPASDSLSFDMIYTLSSKTKPGFTSTCTYTAPIPK